MLFTLFRSHRILSAYRNCPSHTVQLQKNRLYSQLDCFYLAAIGLTLCRITFNFNFNLVWNICQTYNVFLVKYTLKRYRQSFFYCKPASCEIDTQSAMRCESYSATMLMFRCVRYADWFRINWAYIYICSTNTMLHQQSKRPHAVESAVEGFLSEVWWQHLESRLDADIVTLMITSNFS